MGGNQQPSGSTLGASVGTQQAPNSTEQPANSNELAPSAVELAPNSTEQAPNSTEQAGGSAECAGACQHIAAQCAGLEATAEDLAACEAFCSEASFGGCNGEFMAVFSCVAEIACNSNGEEIDGEALASPDSPCYDALLALVECNPQIGEGEVHIGGDNGGGDNGGGDNGGGDNGGGDNGGGEGGAPNIPGGGSGGCAALESCCGMPDAETAPVCMQAYNGAVQAGDQVCGSILGTYQAAGVCP
jgi:hypothetical protein